MHSKIYKWADLKKIDGARHGTQLFLVVVGGKKLRVASIWLAKWEFVIGTNDFERAGLRHLGLRLPTATYRPHYK